MWDHYKTLQYIPLNKKGERAGHPFKASLFGKSAGLPALELHFSKCKTALKDSPTKQTLKSAVTIGLKTTSDEQAFKKQLAEQGINVVVRRNDIGRIYGITFIDHNSKAFWQQNFLPTPLMIIGKITSNRTLKNLPFYNSNYPHQMMRIFLRKNHIICSTS